MNERFEKLLLSELHMAVFAPGDPAVLTDEMLCQAMTLNENLCAQGFVLTAEDVARIAVSPELPGFYQKLEALCPSVDARPMYPGFPRQVMEMPEAMLRMHQLIHYFSTYGMEELFGGVSRGWVPAYDGPERSVSQTAVLKAHVITLVSEEEAAFTALRTLLQRRERLTNPELMLAELALPGCRAEELGTLEVPFKENLELLFPLVLALPDREAALSGLRSLCAHTGDVLRCARSFLRQRHYHLRTAEKKTLVRLLERYPARNLRENLIQSLQARERNLEVLQYLDYNRFARSPEHRELVRALRSGELQSWHAVSEQLLRAGDPAALAHLAQRPGYLVRTLGRLLRLGYPAEAIREQLLPAAGQVSAHLLLKTLRTMSFLSRDGDDAEREKTAEILREALAEHFRRVETPLKDRKLYLALEDIDPVHSSLETEDRSAGGGYVRSGIAYRIPDGVRYLRFFVYWNDPWQVDVDLHAGAKASDGMSVNVGWNGDYHDRGVVYSGDMTCSDSAEYIDIDLEAPLEKVWTNLHLYYGRPSFREIETCYVGMMAVSDLGEDVELYDRRNCFFSHEITQENDALFYGFVDVRRRFLRYVGQPNPNLWASSPPEERMRTDYSLQDYLDCLFAAQGVQLVSDPEEAELILTLEKGQSEKEISLVEQNFFLEC